MSSETVIVDHIGFRAANAADYQSILNSLKNAGLQGIESRAEGHTRTFFDLGHGIRMEVQLWDASLPQSRQQMVHLDVQSSDPMTTLKNINSQAEDWGEDEIPRGGAVVTSYFMVMARPKV